MKKLILLFILYSTIAIATSSSSYSQGFYTPQDDLTTTKIGIRLSPTFSYSRVSTDADNLEVEGTGAALRFIFGPYFDFEIRDNYYFSTGLFYAPKRAGVIVRDKTESTYRKEYYNLQYLQLPASLKLYASDIMQDSKIYFQIGGILEAKIGEEEQSEMNILIDQFRFFDFSIFFGVGLEYRVAENTSLVGGISYNRGLVNVATETSKPFTVKNDLIAIDFGVKF